MNVTGSKVLVVGSGHFALRMREHFAGAGHDIVALGELVAPGRDAIAFHASIQSHALNAVDLGALSAAFLLDDHDEVNLELLIAVRALAPTLSVTAALFNDAIAAHLAIAHPGVRIVNPAAIAAPAFVAALETPVTRRQRLAPPPVPDIGPTHGGDRLLIFLGIAFLVLVAAATAFFRGAEHLSWVDALYFVVATVATVGYGDINLLNSPPSHKLVDIGLIIASTVFIWLIFSLTIDRIIKQRVERSLGRKRYALKGHVIVCGLGRVGRCVVDALVAQGEKVLVVETSERAAGIEQCRARGVDIYIGDARAQRVLQDVAVDRAKALYALTAEDFANVEIGLNARSANPALRVILRVFDHVMAQRIKEQLDIHLAVSMSAIAAEHLVHAPAHANGGR